MHDLMQETLDLLKENTLFEGVFALFSFHIVARYFQAQTGCSISSTRVIRPLRPTSANW